MFNPWIIDPSVLHKDALLQPKWELADAVLAMKALTILVYKYSIESHIDCWYINLKLVHDNRVNYLHLYYSANPITMNIIFNSQNFSKYANLIKSL